MRLKNIMNQIKHIVRHLVITVFVLSFAGAIIAQNSTPAPKLPEGMTGSSTKDPRTHLPPGLFDAGEAAFGMKHLRLLKKPNSFLLGSNDPDSEKVKKTLGSIGMNASAIPKN